MPSFPGVACFHCKTAYLKDRCGSGGAGRSGAQSTVQESPPGDTHEPDSPSLKVTELVKNHTTFAGAEGLYTQTFALSMNKAAYDKLPPDLKKVIDNNSGIETAAFFGRAMDEGDKAGRAIAEKAGNNIVALDVAETQRWRRTAGAVETDWINEVKAKGIDGAKLAAEARALIKKHQR